MKRYLVRAMFLAMVLASGNSYADDYGTHWLEGVAPESQAVASPAKHEDWGVVTSPWTFIACRAMDVGLTGYMLRHYPNVTEANPLGFPAVAGLSLGLSFYLYRNLDDWNNDPRNGLKTFDNAVSCLPVALNLMTLRKIHNQ